MSEKSAKLIKEFLHSYSVTITDFAKASNLSRSSIHKYLDGKRIHPKAAKKIEKGIQEKYRIFIPYEKLID